MATRIGRVHAVIPDVQAKPGVSLEHLRHVGNYLAEKRPDIIVCIGDFADMPSLNSHGKLLELEGQRYSEDIRAAKTAMEMLMTPIRKVKGYHPELHFTLGNHEARIDTEAKNNPKLVGTISTNDLGYEKWGWNVHKFLKVVRVDQIEYSHYFVSGSMGRPVSSAAALLKVRQSSAMMGHTQFTDVAFHRTTGKVAIFTGICYMHEEEYLTPQGNNDRRQIVMAHEVQNGTFDPMFVSLGFLARKYS